MEADIASEDDLKYFQSVTETEGQMKVKLRDNEHYIPHIPSDYHSEKGLSVVGGSFDKEAALAVLDLHGDEGEGGKTQKEKVKW